MYYRDREDWKFKRMRKKITLKQIANLIGCSISLINKWENGHIEIDLEKLKQYMEYVENK